LAATVSLLLQLAPSPIIPTSVAAAEKLCATLIRIGRLGVRESPPYANAYVWNVLLAAGLDTFCLQPEGAFALHAAISTGMGRCAWCLLCTRKHMLICTHFCGCWFFIYKSEVAVQLADEGHRVMRLKHYARRAVRQILADQAAAAEAAARGPDEEQSAWYILTERVRSLDLPQQLKAYLMFDIPQAAPLTPAPA
jgi:hypothetical protein